jgi:hypothetical protein
MASPVRGLLDPKNATEGSGPKFAEGLVRVDKSEFEVFQKRGKKDEAPPAPITALVWTCTRLDEEHRPLTADDGQPLVERLDFGLGSTSVAYVHPARANSPEDEDLEDAGAEVGATGPTIVCAKAGWTLNKKSGLAVLNESLAKAGFFEPGKEMYEWAPAYEGCVFYMTSHAEAIEKDGKKEQYFQKVVSQVVKRAGAGDVKGQAKAPTKTAASASAPAAGKANTKANGSAAAASAPASAPAPAPAESNGAAADTDVTKLLVEHLPGIIAPKLGETLTLKALGSLVGAKIAGKVKGKPAVDMVKVVRDPAWLEENAVGMQVGDDLVSPVFNADRSEVTFQIA